MVYVNVTKYEKKRISIDKFLPLESDEREDFGDVMTRDQFIEAQKKWQLFNGKRNIKNNTDGGKP